MKQDTFYFIGNYPLPCKPTTVSKIARRVLNTIWAILMACCALRKWENVSTVTRHIRQFPTPAECTKMYIHLLPPMVVKKNRSIMKVCHNGRGFVSHYKDRRVSGIYVGNGIVCLLKTEGCCQNKKLSPMLRRHLYISTCFLQCIVSSSSYSILTNIK